MTARSFRHSFGIDWKSRQLKTRPAETVSFRSRPLPLRGSDASPRWVLALLRFSFSEWRTVPFGNGRLCCVWGRSVGRARCPQRRLEQKLHASASVSRVSWHHLRIFPLRSHYLFVVRIVLNSTHRKSYSSTFKIEYVPCL
jgi:hypothetical protein